MNTKPQKVYLHPFTPTKLSIVIIRSYNRTLLGGGIGRFVPTIRLYSLFSNKRGMGLGVVGGIVEGDWVRWWINQQLIVGRVEDFFS